MYEVRITEEGDLTRTRIATLIEVGEFLRSLRAGQKIVGVFELNLSNPDRPISREIPCAVEGDLVVLGKPM